MQRLRMFAAAFLVLLSVGGSMVPVAASADTPKSTVCQALGSGSNCNTTPHNSVNVDKLVRTAVTLLSWVVGVAAVIVLIIGGLRYITANGDSNGISSAKSSIIYALIGLVIVAFAQFIVKFVLNRTTQ